MIQGVKIDLTLSTSMQMDWELYALSGKPHPDDNFILSKEEYEPKWTASYFATMKDTKVGNTEVYKYGIEDTRLIF